MSGRDAVLCVIAGLGVLSVAGMATAAFLLARRAPGGLVVLIVGPALACGLWALLGLAWWVLGGVVG